MKLIEHPHVLQLYDVYENRKYLYVKLVDNLLCFQILFCLSKSIYVFVYPYFTLLSNASTLPNALRA